MNLLRDISQLMILTKESAPPLCMRTRLDSSAPHIHPAAEWHGAAANENALILYKKSDGAIEVGIRRWQQRNTAFFWERDMLCYFMRAHGFLRRDTDGSIEVTPGTAVHFKEGWRGDSGPGVGVVAYLSAALIRSSEK